MFFFNETTSAKTSALLYIGILFFFAYLISLLLFFIAEDFTIIVTPFKFLEECPIKVFIPFLEQEIIFLFLFWSLP